MKVTNVRVRLVNNDGRLRAVSSITISDCFVIHDIRVLESDKGLFVAMPSRKMPNGAFRDVAHPINTETRIELDNMILQAYAEAKENYVAKDVVVEEV